MLTVNRLQNAGYVIESVALGVEEYYAGVGEAPGEWAGRLAPALGLSGLVEADDLRALVDGLHPATREELLSGPGRKVRAFDLTFSAPKSVSVAWALGDPKVHAAAMAAHNQAVTVALGFLEERAAFARRQVSHVRGRVATDGFVAARFVHRTSRDGDPQLHTHVVVPNLVRRTADGLFVAIDATPLFAWKHTAGAIYQNEVQRLLTTQLGVGWGPDRKDTREMAGMDRAWLRAFSKRAESVEAELAASGNDTLPAGRLRMEVTDRAVLATRPAKDHSLTPTALSGRWQAEATAIGTPVGADLSATIATAGEETLPRPSRDVLWAGLVDPESGLCANDPRFGEQDVLRRLAAVSAGRFSLAELEAEAKAFVTSHLVARLVRKDDRVGPVWSTTAHRALEDRVLAALDGLQSRQVRRIDPDAVRAATAGAPHLADDQLSAVRTLCQSCSGVTVMLAPAGYGKTAMVHVAAVAAAATGRRVLGVATTTKAVAELQAAGIDSVTIASLRRESCPVPAGCVVVLDEVSQTSTADADTVLAALGACDGGRLWVLGDPKQGRSVKAGGLAAELAARADADLVPSAALTENRRQLDPQDRAALGRLRAGDADGSQRIRSDQGWEHTATDPETVRCAMAAAIAADLHGGGHRDVVGLTVGHGDAEDLADRIRAHIAAAGHIAGPGLTGPGWTRDRTFQTGDRVLFHARCGQRGASLVNGTTATVTAVTVHGLTVATDSDGKAVQVPAAWIHAAKPDGTPRLSHAWARTIDGAQGGTWAHAHLLGTAALDAYRGYVGQSRSKHPTHTWNTTPIATPETDVAGLRAEEGPIEKDVAAALARTPDATLAALDDPHRVAAPLEAELAAHRQVFASAPRVDPNALADARAAHARALDDHTHRTSALADARAALAAHGPARRLTRTGRAIHRTRQDAVRNLADRVTETAADLARAAVHLEVARAETAALDAWRAAEGWRIDRSRELEDQLAGVWAAAVVNAAHDGDPLAYGEQRLRGAHIHLTRHAIHLLDTPGTTAAELSAARADRDLLRNAVPPWPVPAWQFRAAQIRDRDLGPDLGIDP